jgi:hypothetical protein
VAHAVVQCCDRVGKGEHAQGREARRSDARAPDVATPAESPAPSPAWIGPDYADVGGGRLRKNKGAVPQA